MLTDESEDIDDTEAACLSEFVANGWFLTQEQDFEAQASDLWQQIPGQKAAAPVLEAGRKPST